MKKIKAAAMVLLLCFAFTGCKVWYLDADGDGYGDPENSVEGALQPTGYVMNNLDCNDNDATVYPGAIERPDGIDNQCPGDPGYGDIDEGYDDEHEPVVMDFSAFERFNYMESPSSIIPFLLVLDTINEATISAEADGYHVQISITQLRPDAPDHCPTSGQVSSECFTSVSLPPRILTEAEVQEMDALFSAITIVYLYHPYAVCVDPVLAITIQWDTAIFYQKQSTCYEYGEYEELISDNSVEQIMSFLERLRESME